MSKEDQNSDLEVYAKLYVTDNAGNNLALVGDSQPTNIGWNNNNTTPVFSETDIAIITSQVQVGQRMKVEIYAINNENQNKNVTFYTEGSSHYSYVVTSVSALQGEKGDTGEKGDQGPIGLTGATGPTGPAGADGVSYTEVSINAVPATMLISDFIGIGNSWRDSFVVVPQEYNGWVIAGWVASYGDEWVSVDNTFTVEIRNDAGGSLSSQVVAKQFSYIHQANNRTEQGPVEPPVLVSAGDTINVAFNSGSFVPGGGQPKGYTITLLLTPEG